MCDAHDRISQEAVAAPTRLRELHRRRARGWAAVVSAVAGVFLFGGGAAHAASFDCQKAGNRIERLICEEPTLSSLDTQLQAAFLGAVDRSNSPSQVRERQRAWLNERDACADASCMAAAYRRQIKRMAAVADEPKACRGASTPEINACGAEYSRRADSELARYVAAARKRLREAGEEEFGGSEAEAALRGFDAAQSAWETYRKTECEAFYSWVERRHGSRRDVRGLLVSRHERAYDGDLDHVASFHGQYAPDPPQAGLLWRRALNSFPSSQATARSSQQAERSIALRGPRDGGCRLPRRKGSGRR